MFKNVAGQKVTVYAVDASTGLPKAGDAANITVYVSKDDGAVTALGDATATEADATNAKGDYLFDLTQGETNADKLRFTGKSSTSNVVVVPQTVYTRPNRFSTLAIDAAGGVTLIDGAITDAKITFPAEAAGRPATFLAAMRRVWEWAANKRTRDRTTGTVLLRNAADSGTLETQTQSTAGSTDAISQGA